MKYKQRKIGLNMRQAKKLEKLLHLAYVYAFVSTKMNDSSLEESLEHDKDLDQLWSTVMFLIEVGYSSVGKEILPYENATERRN
jgi:hypothetical protein